MAKDLGECKEFSIVDAIQSIHFEKKGEDTWNGKYVEVVLKQESKGDKEERERCSINDILKPSGIIALQCKSLQKLGKFLESVQIIEG